MTKLINQENLKRLAQGLHNKAKDLVSTEQERATAEEARLEGLINGNTSSIANINNPETGILKQAKDYVDTAIAGVDAGALETRIEVVEAKNTEQDAAIAGKVAKTDIANNLTQTTTGKVLDATQGKALNDKIVAETQRATAAEQANAQAIATEVSNRKGEITRVEGLVTTEKERALAAETSLSERLDVIEGAGEGSITKALTDAKSYTDRKIGEVNGTISTLQGKVTANEGEISKLKDAVSNKNNNTIVVEVESEIATANENPKVGDLAFVISTKRAYIYKGVEAAILADVPAGWVVFDEITNELDLVSYLKKSEAESLYRKKSEKIAEGDLNSALSSKINNKADSSTVTALDGKITTVESKANANASAIEVLNGSGVGSVSKSISTALESYSNTEAVKTMLTGVVGSLELSIVGDEVILSAGGKDTGITISQTKLNLVTTAEIDEMLSSIV